jgi:fucose permease
MNVDKRHINVFTGVVFCAIFFMCMANNIIGPLLGNIMQHYSIRLDSGGLMSMFQNIGGTFAIILFSLIMDKFNKTIAFVAPMFFLAVFMLIVGSAPAYPFFMAAFLFMGISFSTMDILGNALVADVQQENRNKALSIMHGFASVGAVIAPMIAGSILQAGISWQYVYTVVGLFVLIIVVFYALASAYARKSIRAIKTEHLDNKEKGIVKRFLKDKYVWTAVLCTFLFSGYQSGMVVWVSQYFKDVFLSAPVSAGLGLTAYWLGTGLIRFLFGLTRLGKLNTRLVLIYGSILSGIVLMAGVFIHNYYIMLVSVFIAGGLNAPVLPRIVGLVSGWYKKNSGLASSTIFAALYLAYTVFPLIMGEAAFAWGMAALIVIPAISIVLAGFAAVWLPMAHKA